MTKKFDYWLEKGTKVEMEHQKTMKKYVQELMTGKKPYGSVYTDYFAKQVALDHLKESPLYYEYLTKMEKRLKKKR